MSDFEEDDWVPPSEAELKVLGLSFLDIFDILEVSNYLNN